MLRQENILGEFMALIEVAIVNECTVLKDDLVQAIVPALQKQVHRDFAPVWGVDANITFVPQGKQPAADAWWLAVLDNSDQAGTLGYHDLSNNGMPMGKAFAKGDIDKGLKWTVTVSHELLELLVDPAINLTVIDQPDTAAGKLYPYEICDPCESDKYGYDIDGVMVADFVFPSWFQPFRTLGAQFDFQNHIRKPFEVLPGGFIGVYDLGSGSGWHQISAQNEPASYLIRAQPGSRRERRRVPGKQWMRSAVARGRAKQTAL
jgi:hypothetical protein